MDYNANQNQQPMGGNSGIIDNVRDRLQQYGGGQGRRSQIDAALAQAQGGGQTGGQTINSGATGTPGMGSQAPQPAGPTVGYQNIVNTPSQQQQQTIDTIRKMDYHKMDPYTQQYYSEQLGYSPEQMLQTFPAPQPEPAMVQPMGGLTSRGRY
jgi:hypothetical protein